MALSFLDDIGGGSFFSEHALRPSTSGDVFYGLPAIGFLAENFVNANVTAGVLSNYSAVYPHRSSVTLETNTTSAENPQDADP